MQPADRRAAALSALQQSGLCRLPEGVPYLQPYENDAWIADVGKVQQQFFRQAGSVDAARVFGPSSYTCVQQHNGQESHLDLGVELSIAQAPASFALPLMPSTHFNLPFRVTLRFAATSPASLNVGVRASVLTIEELVNIPYWMPLPMADPRLMGAKVNAKLDLIDCGKILADGRRVYTNTHDFLFLGLQFTQTTNREPVFLVFHADLPPPSPHLFSVFLLPTVVCNPRNAIEHADAVQLLWKGTLPPRPTEHPRWTYEDFCTHVTHQLQVAIGLNRGLAPLDCLLLAHRAGFYLKNKPTSGTGDGAVGGNVVWDGPCVDGGPTTEEEIESLQVYVRRTQALLKLMRDYYERMDPQILCGFSIGRREAVSLLEAHPPGTFLLRFSYESGALAISYVISTGQVLHMKLTMAQLQRVSLEELISLHGNLDYLLDPNTGLRYLREQVLDRGYVDDPLLEQLVRAQGQQQRQQQNAVPDGVGNPLNEGPGARAGGGVNINNNKTTTNVSYGASVGSAHAEVRHQASEGEQLPDQGLLMPRGARQ